MPTNREAGLLAHITRVTRRGGRRINDRMGERENLCGGELTLRDLLVADVKRMKLAERADWITCGACLRRLTTETTQEVIRRARRGTAGAALALLLALAGPALAQQPNVAVIVLDDVTVSFFDGTPQLADLATRGVQFDAITPTPLCGPSRASILSGLHTHNHGVDGNLDSEAAWSTLRGDVLPDWFQAAGYRTIKAGKWINGVDRDRTGWNVWLDAHRDLPGFWLDRLARQTARRVRASEQPVFLYFAPGHDWQEPAPRHVGMHALDPLPMPPSFNEADVSDKRWWNGDRPLLTVEDVERITTEYRNARDTMEGVVEAIVKVVEAFGDEPTVFVLVSDNGYQRGEHRIPSGKGQHFEESTRVPLVFFGAGIPAGVRSEALVYPLDLTATLVDLVGLDAPELDGRSLVPLFAEPGAAWRSYAVMEHRYQGVRGKNRKLVTWSNGERELYNLTTDPFELRNRCALDDEACGAGLLPYVDALATCRGAECWAIETLQDPAD